MNKKYFLGLTVSLYLLFLLPGCSFSRNAEEEIKSTLDPFLEKVKSDHYKGKEAEFDEEAKRFKEVYLELEVLCNDLAEYLKEDEEELKEKDIIDF